MNDSSSASARRAGTKDATELITALAGAGMPADRAGAVAGDVPWLRSGQPTATPEESCTAFGQAAASLVAGLRDLEAG